MKNYSLNLPVYESLLPIDYPVQVTTKSDIKLRKHFQKLSDYFVDEFNYNRKPQYASTTSNSFRGYLLTEYDYDAKNSNTYRIYGACCFDEIQFGELQSIWRLEWIWLHPFFRHRGNLKKHWEFLEIECGDFLIKRPLSNDMKSFIEKTEGNHLY